jgi:hypothetical protein
MVIDDAKAILSELSMPKKQQADICAYTLLSLAGISENMVWTSATNEYMRIHDVIEYIRRKFDIDYAENSRETFRKQAMHPFRTAAIIEDNGKATNSPHYRYRLTPEALEVIKSFDTDTWNSELTLFKRTHDSLKMKYASKKAVSKMPVTLDDKRFSLSVGKHNALQKAVIEEFKPRFAPNSKGLYLGDTTNKYLYMEVAELDRIGIEITMHDKLPDIILYEAEKDWIFFIEAVTSVGPMSSKRILEINEFTKNSKSGKVFVTAFPDGKTFKKFYDELAWETEVWIADNPDHLLHLNGDRFLGPKL